jgi:hypothetical protein
MTRAVAWTPTPLAQVSSASASRERGGAALGEDWVHRKVDVNVIHLVVPMHRVDDTLDKQWLSVRRFQTVCA